MVTQKPRPQLKPAPPEDIAVSLSGGGHRATLFGLGVLIALVDRGLNKRVKQIASVSGGSIVNAFIATHCNFDDPDLTTCATSKGIIFLSIGLILFPGYSVPAR